MQHQGVEVGIKQLVLSPDPTLMLGGVLGPGTRNNKIMHSV